MDKVGPDFLVTVGLMLLTVIAACVIYDFRHELWTLAGAVRRRYLRGPSLHELAARIADDDDMLSDVPDEEDIEPLVTSVAVAYESALQPVATPNNGDNVALRVVAPNNVPDNKVGDITEYEQGQLDALALLIVESRKKAFQDGRVPETRGITTLFGVSTSSDVKSKYQKLRGLLKQRLDELNAPAPVPAAKFNLTPEQVAFRENIGLQEQEA